jgi:hypothetical protein
MKVFLLSISVFLVLLYPFVHTFAVDQEFVVLPRAESGVQELWVLVDQVGGKQWVGPSLVTGDTVRERYNQAAVLTDQSIGNQLSTGILTRDSILDIVAYAVRKLSELALLIGWLTIVYAGYLYSMSVRQWSVWEANSAIQNAVIGILVIIFSYSLIRIISGAFLFYCSFGVLRFAIATSYRMSIHN